MLNWLRTGVFVALPSLLLLVGLEIYARHHFQILLPTTVLAPGHPGELGCLPPDPLMGFVPARGRCGNDQDGIMIRAAGPGSPDALRVLLLGDSVANSFRNATLLEQRLSEGWGGAPTILRNLAVSGYDSCQEWQHLERTGWALNPVLVILLYCVNDGNLQTILAPVDDGKVMLTSGERRYVFPRMFLHSNLAMWLATRAFNTSAYNHQNIDHLSRNCVSAMAQGAARRGVNFVVGLVPALIDATPEQLRDTGKSLTEVTQLPRPGGGPPVLAWEIVARRELQELGVPLLDLRPVLEAWGPLEQLRAGSEDVIHVGPVARDLIMEATARFVLESGQVPTRQKAAVTP